MQTITPFLWFNDNAEEAVDFYLSVFEHAKKTGGAPGPGGKPLTIAFQLNGQNFVALNGGPMFKFTEAISFVVNCETQAEIDRYWNQLTANGGSESRCGWLKDPFGLSWQIVPSKLGQLLSNPDPAKAGRAMQAMLKMNKIVIADLENA